MFWKTAILLLMTIVLSGCLFVSENFKPISYYDLGRPETLAKPGFEMGSFRMTGPYKFSMVFRHRSNELSVDDYNKWVQTPENLLKTYLLTCFGNSEVDSSSSLSLSGSILTFEADCSSEKKYAVLAVEYSFESKKLDSSIGALKTYKVEMRDASAPAFAEAMSTATANFAKDLMAQMDDINKVKEPK